MKQFHKMNAWIESLTCGHETFWSYSTREVEYYLAHDSDGNFYHVFFLNPNCVSYSLSTTRQVTRYISEKAFNPLDDWHIRAADVRKWMDLYDAKKQPIFMTYYDENVIFGGYLSDCVDQPISRMGLYW